MYGYHLGGPEGWKIQEISEYEPLVTDWYDKDNDDFLAAIEAKLLEMVGFFDTYKTSPDTYYQDRPAADKRLKVKVIFTGSEHGFDYTLYAAGSHQEVEWGAQPVELAIPDDADRNLAAAIAHLGIAPMQPAPSWVLGALYL
jgi:hypothetical protein